MQLRDEITERRLFGAIVFEADVLAWCTDVETDDFSDLHLKFAFRALRNLLAHGEPVDFAALLAEIARCGYAQVDTLRIAEAANEPPYNHEILVRNDVRWLHRLARRRADLDLIVQPRKVRR